MTWDSLSGNSSVPVTSWKVCICCNAHIKHTSEEGWRGRLQQWKQSDVWNGITGPLLHRHRGPWLAVYLTALGQKAGAHPCLGLWEPNAHVYIMLPWHPHPSSLDLTDVLCHPAAAVAKLPGLFRSGRSVFTGSDTAGHSSLSLSNLHASVRQTVSESSPGTWHACDPSSQPQGAAAHALIVGDRSLTTTTHYRTGPLPGGVLAHR